MNFSSAKRWRQKSDRIRIRLPRNCGVSGRYEASVSSSRLVIAPVPKCRIESGFTLIELVISSALTAIILISAYACLRGGVSSDKLIESRSRAAQSARVAMSLMTADLRCATKLSKDFEFLGMSRMLGDVEADNLDFGTRNYTPRAPREGDFCEVSYFLDKNRETGSYSLWRRRDPTPDPEPLSGGSREEIAEDLLGLRFEYYDGFEWFDDWGDSEGKRRASDSILDPGNLSGMPEAVRITILAAVDNVPASKDSDAIKNREPPLVFQTVARLNIIAPALSGESNGSSTSNQSNQSPAPPISEARP